MITRTSLALLSATAAMTQMAVAAPIVLANPSFEELRNLSGDPYDLEESNYLLLSNGTVYAPTTPPDPAVEVESGVTAVGLEGLPNQAGSARIVDPFDFIAGMTGENVGATAGLDGGYGIFTVPLGVFLEPGLWTLQADIGGARFSPQTSLIKLTVGLPQGGFPGNEVAGPIERFGIAGIGNNLAPQVVTYDIQPENGAIGQLVYLTFERNDAGTGYIDNIAVDANVIPEPTSLGLVALGAIGIMGRRRRKA